MFGILLHRIEKNDLIFMNQNLLFFILTCLCFTSCTNREDDIKAVVNKWNELHNTHNVDEFKEIYAPDVLFYGRQTSMETCYARKRAFLTSAFRQEIISAITISYYSSGTIKCDFTKRTSYRKEKVREYYCYLLLKKQGSKYLISGESDLLSDQKRNTQLNLGNKLARPSGNKGIYITLVILLLAGLTIHQFRKKAKKEANEWEIFKEQYKAPETSEKKITDIPVTEMPYDENMAETIKETVLKELKNHFPVDSPQQKGLLFEKFIVEKFNKDYFQLYEWRSDKFHGGIYAASSSLPDLEYNFKTSRHNLKIAVECKWRAKFINNKVEIASEKNMENYWRYMVDRQIPVFIVLGIGGKPEAPEELYIIPLDGIPDRILHRKQLNEYQRYHGKGDFFYNADAGILE